MLEITIGALSTLLGVAVGCMVLELTMRALRYSLRASVSYEKAGEDFHTAGSSVAWDVEQVPAAIPSFVPGEQPGAAVSLRRANHI